MDDTLHTCIRGITIIQYYCTLCKCDILNSILKSIAEAKYLLKTSIEFLKNESLPRIEVESSNFYHCLWGISILNTGFIQMIWLTCDPRCLRPRIESWAAFSKQKMVSFFRFKAMSRQKAQLGFLSSGLTSFWNIDLAAKRLAGTGASVLRQDPKV